MSRPAQPAVRRTLVTAPAGAGKTTRLVCEYLELIQRGISVDRIVAITFTRRAAAELVDRVAAVLLHAAGLVVLPPARLVPYAEKKLLPAPDVAKRALALLAAAPVSTVDSFVIALLQQLQLHAHLPLPGGGEAWIDGAVQLESEVGEVYELAARETIDEMGKDVELLLAHVGLQKLAADLARLAQEPELVRPSLRTFVDAVGKRVRSAIKADPTRAGQLVDVVNKDGEPATAAVLAWIADPKRSTPDGIVPWLCTLKAAKKLEALGAEWLLGVRDAAFAAACKELGLHFSPNHPLGADVAWSVEGYAAQADALAEAAVRLATVVRRRTLAAMAASGRLGYAELLLAATTLCRAKPEVIRDRFDALLVDEVQDTSPEQLQLYQAFSAVGTAARPMSAFFVGDVRQSIYRFRGADPQGWQELMDEAGEGNVEPLKTNRRSSRLLVDVYRELVGALSGSGKGLAALGDVKAAREEEGLLEGLPHTAPAIFVDGPEEGDAPDLAAVALFVERLKARWKTHPHETAAVLVKKWDSARTVATQLEQLGLHARVTGDRALLGSRTAQDLRLLLRALLDPSDEIAVVGLLKHPSVGLTDAALVELRRTHGFGRATLPFGAPEGMSAGDAARLACVQAALAPARKRLGAEPTAEVLERVVAALHWRPMLHAGPEARDGQAVAELDVLLDTIRGLESEGTDPARVLAGLTPDPARPDDLAAIRLHADERLVEVTTIHQAKGLEWDHLAVIGFDGKGKGARVEGALVGSMRDGLRAMVGVRFDPDGAMAPSSDPIAKLLVATATKAGAEEDSRLLYVAITRAKQSVLVALGMNKSAKDPGTVGDLRAALSGVAGVAGVAAKLPTAIAVVKVGDVTVPVPKLRRHKPTGRVRDFEAAWAADSKGVIITSPTSLVRDLAPAQMDALETRYARSFSLVEGKTALTRPAAGRLGELDERTLGDVVHGWLDVWSFEGVPDEAQARAYLASRWCLEAEDAAGALARWLVSLGLDLRDHLPGFGDLVVTGRRPEWPVVGFIDGMLVSGRADLVIDRADGTSVIIDFKAGKHSARTFKEVGNNYVAQLEAYRRILTAAGKRVAEVGLVYVRGATWVRFAQDPV